MSETFTPKQVARAIGVSESSLKRWCDQGLIPMVCTAGGHRRLPVQGVLDFIKSTQRTLVDPEVLGLPAPSSGKHMSLTSAVEELVGRLTAGDEAGSRRLLLDLFLDQHRVSLLGDQVLRPAFEEIGRQWECGDVEVYRERFACRICARVIDEIRRLIPPSPATASLAIGAAPSGDWYDLPANLIDLVVRQNGWRSLALGNNLPLETLIEALQKHQPRMVWLSVSHLADRAGFVRGFSELARATGSEVPLIVGGRALDAELLAALPAVTYCRDLAALESQLQKIVPTPPAS